MTVDYTIKVGGEAGQGIQSVGGLLTRAFATVGMEVFAHQDYMSRVRGGHNFFQIRASDQAVAAGRERVDILIALDQTSIEEHACEVVEGGVLIYDGEQKGFSCEGVHCFSVPLKRLAEDAGSAVMANTVATAAVWGLLGGRLEIIFRLLQKMFEGKGEKVVSGNRNAAQSGYDYAKDKGVERSTFSLPDERESKKMLLRGIHAAGLGALAAGCRFVSAYPMTPSTALSEFMATRGRDLGVVFEQAEDEIAAIHMGLGASYAGVRALVPTSGGGFCLMVEGLGLAGCTETPIVIMNGQRPGPSTGLPTRTEQGDLLFAISASHGEFPRAVLAPSTVEETFYLMAHAFNIADRYQMPVIVLMDQYLADTYQTVDKPDTSKVTIDRGKLWDGAGGYKRHLLTEDGISPRAFPGRSKQLVVTTGDEHDEYGHLIESAEIRIRQMDKRLRKMKLIAGDIPPPRTYGDSNALTAVVGWGSTFGILNEVVEALLHEGVQLRGVHLSGLWPFPGDGFRHALAGAERVIFVENNATGQLARLARSETDIAADSLISKYDGRPFTVEWLKAELRKAVG
jgi:2-oxoglutarate ferredoxin oxidoreductase subunit alpha